MKDYHEVAENVFRRRDEYEAQKAARRQNWQKITTSLSAFAIVMVFLFTAGTCYVFAVGLGIVEDTFGICDKFFAVSITQKQQDVVENAAVELGDVVSCDGFSITAKSAFTDGSTAFVLLQISAPEHLNLDIGDIFFDIDFRGIIRGDNPSKALGAGDSRITLFPVDDQDGVKHTHEMLLRIVTSSLPSDGFSFADGYDRYINFEGIYTYEPDFPYTKHQISDGKWSFRIRFDDAFCNTEKEMLATPIKLSTKRAMYDVSQTATVRSIVVKGLSIILSYSYENNSVQEPGDFGDIKVVLTDGTVIETRNSMGVPGDYKGEFIASYIATAPILVDEIDYIQIGETIIPASGSVR